MDRAQVGLEYLITYGWAFVIVAAIITAIAWTLSGTGEEMAFYSSDPTKLVFKAGNIENSQAQILLQNLTGGDIEISSIGWPGDYTDCAVNGENPLTTVLAERKCCSRAGHKAATAQLALPMKTSGACKGLQPFPGIKMNKK